MDAIRVKRLKENAVLPTYGSIEAAGADEFITFNIHEECVLNFFDIPARNISAMPAIAEYLNKKLFKKGKDKPIVIAPDKGAYGFAQEISEIIGYEKDEILLNVLFRFDETEGWKKEGELKNKEKLMAAGIPDGEGL